MPIIGVGGIDDADTAWEKWKLRIDAKLPECLLVNGDHSHLQQAIENLIFNARDATFEMRNHLREEARKSSRYRPAPSPRTPAIYPREENFTPARSVYHATYR